MKAFAIVIRNYQLSEQAFSALLASSRAVNNDFNIERFDAIVPNQTDDLMNSLKLRWNWPWKGVVYDKATNIKKHAYPNANPKRRVACALSHYLLWRRCVELNEPILILEHDALFVKKFDYQYVLDSDHQVIGINDPRNATRLDDKFYKAIQANPNAIQDAPIIDSIETAQGIAGASAYVVKPQGCKLILEAVAEHGLWPNDALICQQLFDFIGVTKQFYTKLQDIESTTRKQDGLLEDLNVFERLLIKIRKEIKSLMS